MPAISVIGLGAMGASYAAKLAGVPDARLRVIASGQRAARLLSQGVTVNGHHLGFPVVAPDDPVEPADLLVVAVKYTGFAEALRQIRHHVGPGTVIMSLLNGITSETELAAAYPQAEVLYSITVGVDAVRRGQEVTYSSLGRIEFGQAHNQAPYSPAVQWLAGVFDSCGLTYAIAPDMIRQLWWKFLINDGVNQVTALLKAPYAVVQQPDSPARATMTAAQREVVAVAQAKGIALTEADITAWLDVLAGLGPGQYTSMAQDALAGRPTETDIFGGAMRRMGAETGLPTPVNTVLNQLLLAQAGLAPTPA